MYRFAQRLIVNLAEICIMYSIVLTVLNETLVQVQVPSLGIVDSAVAIAQMFLACLQCVTCHGATKVSECLKLDLRTGSFNLSLPSH